jgi:hypothetical protein
MTRRSAYRLYFGLAVLPAAVFGRSETMVRVHPIDPAESIGAPYEVRAGETVIPLERAGRKERVYYARFSSDSEIQITVRSLKGDILSATVEPDRFGAGVKVKGKRVFLGARDLGPRIVRLETETGDLPALFVILEPPEEKTPAESGLGIYHFSEHEIASSTQPQTEKIQKVLDECAGSLHGGIVYVPPGRYRTGTLYVRDNTLIYLAGGAVLEASHDPLAFPPSSGTSEQGAGHHTDRNYRVILFDGATNAGIFGRGTIDAAGHIHRDIHRVRLQVIDAQRCDNLRIEGVVLRNSGSWTLHIVGCDNVYVSDVKIIDDLGVANSDGIDPDSSTNVVVERVFCWTGDDSLVVKATGNAGILRDSSNIVFRDSVVSSRKTALKIGTETRADIRNVVFENIDVIRSSRGIGVWMRDGHEIADVVFRDIRMDLIELDGEGRSGQPFYITLRDRAGVGRIRDLRIERVECSAPWYSRFETLPGSPFENVVLEDISWKVLSRTLKKDVRPLFYGEPGASVEIRGLHVDWSSANRDQWDGMWNQNAPVSAVEVTEGS